MRPTFDWQTDASIAVAYSCNFSGGADSQTASNYTISPPFRWLDVLMMMINCRRSRKRMIRAPAHWIFSRRSVDGRSDQCAKWQWQRWMMRRETVQRIFITKLTVATLNWIAWKVIDLLWSECFYILLLKIYRHWPTKLASAFLPADEISYCRIIWFWFVYFFQKKKKNIKIDFEWTDRKSQSAFGVCSKSSLGRFDRRSKKEKKTKQNSKSVVTRNQIEIHFWLGLTKVARAP